MSDMPTVTLTSLDIIEISERMHKIMKQESDYAHSQGFLKFLLCRAIKDVKAVDFFIEVHEIG